MTAILEQLQGLVAAAEIPAGTLGVALILGLFGLMVVGLVLGQELAFVLGGAGVIVGWLAWGTPGVTIAMTKIYDQMQSYSMVAIPMFVLMANFLTHSKVADGLFESIRYLLGPLKGGLGLAVIPVSTVFAATTGIVGVLRGGGDVRIAMLIDVLPLWCFTLPLLVLLGLVLHAPIAIFCFIMATESALKVPFGLHRIRGGKWIHDVTQDLNA